MKKLIYSMLIAASSLFLVNSLSAQSDSLSARPPSVVVQNDTLKVSLPVPENNVDIGIETFANAIISTAIMIDNDGQLIPGISNQITRFTFVSIFSLIAAAINRRRNKRKLARELKKYVTNNN